MKQNLSQGVCPFCKYPINNENEYHACPGCQVPHHVGCWRQNSGCTTFACTGLESSGTNTVAEDCSFDDLAEEYSTNKLVINLEDLQDEDSISRQYPGLREDHYPAVKDKTKFISQGAIRPLVWAGLIGGFITWLIAGRIFNFAYYANHQLFTMVWFEVMAFSSMMGGIIGACLGSVEGLTGKASLKAVNGMLAGLVVGVAGAGIGSLAGQLIYNSLGGSTIDQLFLLIITRSIFWGLVGLFVGYGQGIGAGGGEKAKNGATGGLIGGTAGGLCFELLYMFLESAALSALIAISTFGVCIALGVGMVQEIRKEAWLKVLRGATAGKEHIIYKGKTTIGSHPKSDIVLVMDSSVASNHAVINYNNYHYINSCSGQSGVSVNNKNVQTCRLKNGDRLRIGNYEMIYHEKNVH